MLKVEYREVKPREPLSDGISDRMCREQIVTILMLDPDRVYSAEEASETLYDAGLERLRAEYRLKGFVSKLKDEKDKDGVPNKEPARWYGRTLLDELSAKQVHLGLLFMEKLKKCQEAEPGDYYVHRNKMLGPFFPGTTKLINPPIVVSKSKSKRNKRLAATEPTEGKAEAALHTKDANPQATSTVAEESTPQGSQSDLDPSNEPSHQEPSEESTTQGSRPDFVPSIGGSDLRSSHFSSDLKKKVVNLGWVLGLAVAAGIILFICFELFTPEKDLSIGAPPPPSKTNYQLLP